MNAMMRVPMKLIPIVIALLILLGGQSFPQSIGGSSGINSVSGSGGGAGSQASKRAVFNMNLFSNPDYAFINHLLEGDSVLSPNGATSFKSTASWNSSTLDANGWPNTACCRSQGVNIFGGGLLVPSSSNFAGPYTLDGVGTGVFRTLSSGTATTLTGVQCGGVPSGVAPNTSGAGWGWSLFGGTTNIGWTLTDTGNGFCIPFTVSGFNASSSLNWQVYQSDTSGTGSYVKNLRWYRQSDYTDLAAGKIFRAAFKQPIVTMHPSAIRFMNPNEGANSPNVRWENRVLPTTASLWTGQYWLNSPPYLLTSGTNSYTVAAATGMPITMKQGEVAVMQVVNATTPNGNFGVSAITNANPGAVTTSASTGFSTGDIIIHTNTTGMINLNYYPVCINVVDATHYTLAVAVFPPTPGSCSGASVNTTTWGAFTGTSSNTRATEHVSLNVGGRGVFPIAEADGQIPLVYFGSIGINSYQKFVFDKNSCAITDGAGNNVCGAWILPGGNWGAPIETQIALINELNVMLSVGQGPINMWVTLPQMGLMPNDPDYTTASDWPVNMTKLIMQGNGSQAALTSSAQLIIEPPDETWNGGSGFWATAYYERQGNIRWQNSPSDVSDFSTLRAILSFVDIQASPYYNPSRVKFAMMGGINQDSPGQVGTGNYVRIFGSSLLNGWNGTTFGSPDPLWPAAGTFPYKYFDYIGYAPYILVQTAFATANFTTMAAQWAADAGNAPAQAVDCQNWINGFILYINGGGGTSSNTLDPQFTSVAVATNKTFVNYEGGIWQCSNNNGTQSLGCTVNGSAITTSQGQFLYACSIQSQAASNMLQAYVQTYNAPNKGMPSIYTAIGEIWGLTAPDTYGTTSTEGAGYGLPWTRGLTNYNASVKMIDEHATRQMMLGESNDNLSYARVVGW